MATSGRKPTPTSSPRRDGDNARHVSGNVVVRGDISKVDDEQRLVFGYAYVCQNDTGQVVDKSGDFVEDSEELAKAAYDFVLKSRDGGDWHKRVGVSTMVESVVFTPEKIAKMGLPDTTPTGWWVGYKIHDDEVWGKVKDGTYSSFSVHGKGVRKEVKDATE
jgi:hypothetical protein